MTAEFATPHVNIPDRIRPFNLGLVLLWIGATGVGWFAITVGGGAGGLLIISPLLAALLGALQRRVLKLAGYGIEAGWTERTVLGWLVGLVANFVVLQFIYNIHHSQRGFLLIWVEGDQVEIAAQVGGWALMGAILGAFQWYAPLTNAWFKSRWRLSETPVAVQSYNDRNYARQALWWSVVNAIAWGAGALASWAVNKAFIIGYEPICIACIMQFLWCSIAGGLVIALVTGIALWHRPLGTLLGITIGTVVAYLVLNNMTVGLAGTMGIFDNSPEIDSSPGVTYNSLGAIAGFTPTTISAFDQRQLLPSRILESTNAETRYVAFSEDGTLLAAQKDYWQQGPSILIWRTSDWKQLGTISVQTSEIVATPRQEYVIISDTLATVTPTPILSLPTTRIDYPGGIQATAVLSLDGKIHIWNATDAEPQSELNSIDLKAESNKSPDGKLIITKRSELRRTSNFELITYLREPSDYEGSSPNRLVFTFSPDGQVIAGGSDNGGVWLWDVP